jgi:hypothetical protein
VAYHFVNNNGPYSVTTKHDKELNILAIKICDTAKVWIKVAKISNKTTTEMANILDQVWFCCYWFNEFLGREFQELLWLYGVQLISTKITKSQEIFLGE